jgi:hypothetical protein
MTTHSRLTQEQLAPIEIPFSRAKLAPDAIVRGLFWGMAILLGFLQAWASRMDMVNDTISYLDMGDYIFAGQWSKAITGIWNPLYACFLGLTLHIFRPSPYWEYPVVHLLLFAIFLVAAGCFNFFLREMILFHRRQNDGASAPIWVYLTAGYIFFLWSSLGLIRVSETNPDMLVAAFFYLGCAFLVRTRRSQAEWWAYLGMGLALGLAYLTKSVMFPVSALCLAVLLLIDIRRSRGVSRAIVAFLVFLCVSMPFVTALSISKRKLTFGESGVYNYLVHVNGLPYSHSQGGSGDDPPLLHPTQRVFERPATFKFEGSVAGSYPVWYDPSYWYEGAKPKFRLHEMAVTLLANLRELTYLVLIAFNGSLCSGLFLLFYVSGRGRLILRDIAGFWFLLIPALAALFLYAFVHIETRYIAPFLVVVILSLWFSVNLRPSSEARHLLPATALLLVLMFFSPIGPDAIRKNTSSVLEFLKPFHTQPNRNQEVVSALYAMGLTSGDRIASLEYANCAVRLSSCEGVATWARLGHFKVVAEVNYWPESLSTRDNSFWASDTVTQEKVIQALAESGARVVLSRQSPRGVGAGGWHQVGNTPYYMRWLTAGAN